MDTSKRYLQGALTSIRKSLETRQQINVSDEEIVQKIGISKTQLDDYLNGEETIPDDLVPNLLAAYGQRIVSCIDIVERYVDIQPDEDEQS